ncbi:hypothetical protein [Metabacillus fastidiosus]|uniref:hypothetical protein n=1 Tax=Metabacillus fastidiosus TaxID=1458 RepID=UPI003D2C47ED
MEWRGENYINQQKEGILYQYFSALLEISTIEELAELLNKFQKTLKCPDEKLIELVRGSFYAAYDLSKGANKLHHVKSYITLSVFNQIQANMSEIFDSYLERIGRLESQNTYTPICGYCR